MFDAFVTYHAFQHPHRNAIVSPSGTMTFSDLDAMVGRFSRALAGMVKPADGVVAVQFGNPVTQWVILLALARLGVASSCAADVRAPFRITDQADPENGQPFFHASDTWVGEVQASPAGQHGPMPPGRQPLGRVLMSSGTTGYPKRIGLSWAQVNTAVRGAVVLYGPGRPGPWMAAELGIDSVFGFTACLAAWAAGQPLLLRGGADMEAMLVRFEPAVAALNPLQLQQVLAQLPRGFKPNAGLRLFVPGGALKPALAQQARLRLTPDIRLVYGASECGAAAIGDALLLDEHPGAAGHAVPGAVIEIVDAEGGTLPAGQQGEVRIQTDRLVEDYLDHQDRSGPSPLRDGWFYPGDLGRLTRDGLLLIDGRTDDVMNIGGMKVTAAVLEQALDACPGVVEAAAFAAPTLEGVDQCCVAVVRTDDFDESVASDLLRNCGTVLPPVRLIFVGHLPRTSTGKVERPVLVALAASAR